MDRRRFLQDVTRTATALTTVGALPLSLEEVYASARAQKYNIVFILIDDLGWADVGCNHAATFYETPHIDRLAREGMRFTDAYAACPVCSPTRASILTGKYPARLGITDWIPGENRSEKLAAVPNADHLALEEETIAEALHRSGYKTGMVGKWHLGKDDYYPDKQGFDLNIAGCHWGQPPQGYFAPWNIPTLKEGPPGRHLDDRLTEEAESFLTANRANPFYLHFCHYSVHTPIQAEKERIEKYRSKLASWKRDGTGHRQPEHDVVNREVQDNPVYAAMIENMDNSVGRVLQKIRDLGIEDRTVVVFTSDNGGLSTTPDAPTSNRPLRAGKGWLYEGGIRVPLLVKWPGLTRPGSTCTVPVTSVDFFPTLLTAAQVPLRPKQTLDGADLVPLLRGRTEKENLRAIFWHYPHYHRSGHRPSGAVRFGEFKLIEYFEDMRVELFHLKEDLSERRNLAAERPEIVTRLRKMLHQWRKHTGAKMPEVARPQE